MVADCCSPIWVDFDETAVAGLVAESSGGFADAAVFVVELVENGDGFVVVVVEFALAEVVD